MPGSPAKRKADTSILIGVYGSRQDRINQRNILSTATPNTQAEFVKALKELYNFGGFFTYKKLPGLILLSSISEAYALLSPPEEVDVVALVEFVGKEKMYDPRS